MRNINPTVYTNGFFGSFLKSPTQMGSLGVDNSVTNISRLGTFKEYKGTRKVNNPTASLPFSQAKGLYLPYRRRNITY